MKKKVNVISVLATIALAAAQLLGPKLAPVVQTIIPSIAEIINAILLGTAGTSLITSD